MRQSSIIIHRGKKEEKYEIYVEDYVISFLKEKEGTLEETEILFYGRKEKSGRRYTIYGAGQDRHLDVFGKYDLLEEIGCRLTQEGPVFLIREENGIYEVKGYDVFYYDNEEMQDYLIHQDREKDKDFKSSDRDAFAASGQDELPRMPGYIACQTVQRSKKSTSHYAVSLQLGFIFVILIAIVINSANSYDKMEQLNQSAEEVFFVMENQEAEEQETVQNDIVVQRNDSQDDILQENVQKENENVDLTDSSGSEEKENAEGALENKNKSESDMQAQSGETETDTEVKNTTTETGNEGNVQIASTESNDDTQAESAAAPSEENTQQDEENESSVEALSRNVARYYEVKRGDTLYMISKKIYGDISHVNKICELNQITDPDNIHYGQKIILP